MHCDGEVTEQYLNICMKNGCKLDLRLNDKITVDYKYLKETISIIEEVSIKLSQVLWRKCFNENKYCEEFDQVLNDYIFSLLINEEWDLAKELGDFAYNIIKTSSEEFKMIFLINYCIALNNLKEHEKTIALLEQIDFSAINQEFLLAKCVLLYDKDNVIKLMHRIGTTGVYFNKESYASFPLFNEIRKDEDFKLKYKNLFDEDIDKEEIKLKLRETEEEEQN